MLSIEVTQQELNFPNLTISQDYRVAFSGIGVLIGIEPILTALNCLPNTVHWQGAEVDDVGGTFPSDFVGLAGNTCALFHAFDCWAADEAYDDP